MQRDTKSLPDRLALNNGLFLPSHGTRGDSLKVVLLSDAFSTKMGYLENVLPKYLARDGTDVHVVVMDLPPYFWAKEFKETYADFSEQLPAGSIVNHDGYTLHILGHRKIAGYMRMVGLRRKLQSILPDIVQTTTSIGWTALEAAFYKPFFGYKLFTGCHMAASVFTLATKNLPWWHRQRLHCTLMRALPGRLTASASEKCYAITEDGAHIASDFFGVPSRKVEVMYLGVDTEYFHPASSPELARERIQLRRQLGFLDHEVVCVYSGKFQADKKVILLAEAVERLRQAGQPFRALFIGNGPQRRELEKFSSPVILGFMPFFRLGRYYRSADIGVWPGNESTSMLDAAACGIPVVISDEVSYRAPVDGNGHVFKSDNVDDLAGVLLKLREPELRQRLGLRGAARMAAQFSWETIASRRLRDYRSVLYPDENKAARVTETIGS